LKQPELKIFNACADDDESSCRVSCDHQIRA